LIGTGATTQLSRWPRSRSSNAVNARLATERVFQRRLAERDERKAPGGVLQPSIRGFELLSLLVPMSRVDTTGSYDPLKPSASESRTGAVPHAPLARQSINWGGGAGLHWATASVRCERTQSRSLALSSACFRPRTRRPEIKKGAQEGSSAYGRLTRSPSNDPAWSGCWRPPPVGLPPRQRRGEQQQR
jgi:hypothetical protein